MKGRVDVRGLRLIEQELGPLGNTIGLGLASIVEGWRYFLIVVEHDGDGAAWTASTIGAEKLPAVARNMAANLRERGGRRDLTVTPLEGPRPGLKPKQVHALAILVRAFAELIPQCLPPRWGWGLLLYDPDYDVGRVWTSTCAPEDEPAMLDEFARTLDAGGGYPPGVVGRWH